VLTVNGSLAVSGTLDANDNVTVAAAGVLDVGGGTDTVAGSLTVNGTFLSTGTLVLDGSAQANLISASPLPNLQIARASGSQLFLTGNVTASSFTLVSGTFNAGNVGGEVLTVTGNALFQGGALLAGNPGSINVAGSVTFSGTIATSTIPTIRCAGNWTADA